MVERLKSGTSISNLRPSELDTTTNHSTSRALVEQETCKSGAPIPDGSKFSNSKMEPLLIQLTTRFLKLLIERMRKAKPLLSTV
jgi:hypothetical protein